MASPTSIVNIALGMLKEGEIMSVDPPDVDRRAASVANAVYEDALKETLRLHTWTFARARATLAAVDTEGTTLVLEDVGYQNVFALPPDYIRMIACTIAKDRYTLEGGNLLTDEAGPIGLVYVKYETDTTKFDPLFVKAFVCVLARDMAMPLSHDIQVYERMEARLVERLQDARTVNGQELPAEQIEADDFDDARWGFVNVPFRRIAIGS